MFTGIVQELGTVERMQRSRTVDRLTVSASKTAARVGPGESVAINGTCLTVVRAQAGRLLFEMIPQTRRLTNLGALTMGARVNVEPSLSLSDRLNGHLVLGHVDGIATVSRRTRVAAGEALEVRVPAALGRYLVPQGPVALDGVSLTIGAKSAAAKCVVYLIPETLTRTTLALRRVGDAVNVEVDYVAKLIVQRAGRSS
jgi:riboflavin synthase